MADRKKVLVTGMAGQIGGIVRRFLDDKYELTGLDRVDVEECPTVVADLSDLDAIRPAFDDVETVVHLGADPNARGAWESVLDNNIIGTRNVFEASRDGALGLVGRDLIRIPLVGRGSDLGQPSPAPHLQPRLGQLGSSHTCSDNDLTPSQSPPRGGDVKSLPPVGED